MSKPTHNLVDGESAQGAGHPADRGDSQAPSGDSLAGLRLALRRARARSRYARKKAARGQAVKPWLGAPRRDPEGLAEQARLRKAYLSSLLKQERKMARAAVDAVAHAEPAPPAALPAAPSVPEPATVALPAVLDGDLFGAAAPPASAKVATNRASTDRSCPIREIVLAFNSVMKDFPAVTKIRDVERFLSHRDARALEARWNEMMGRDTHSDVLRPYQSVEDGIAAWTAMFECLTESDFLMGRTPRSDGHSNWTFSLRTLVAPRMFARVVDGEHGVGPKRARGAGLPLLARFVSEYPPHRLGDQASLRAYWSSNSLEAAGQAILDGLAAWKRSEDWLADDGKYVPKASSFLAGRKYAHRPRASAKGSATVIASRTVSGWSGSPLDTGDWRYLHFPGGWWIASSGTVVLEADAADPARPRTGAFMREVETHGRAVEVLREQLHPYIEQRIQVREGRLDRLAIGEPDYAGIYAWAESVLGTPQAWAVTGQPARSQQMEERQV